jgi:hypothetical protein
MAAIADMARRISCPRGRQPSRRDAPREVTVPLRLVPPTLYTQSLIRTPSVPPGSPDRFHGFITQHSTVSTASDPVASSHDTLTLAGRRHYTAGGPMSAIGRACSVATARVARRTPSGNGMDSYLFDRIWWLTASDNRGPGTNTACRVLCNHLRPADKRESVTKSITR